MSHAASDRKGYVLQELTIGLLVFALAVVPILGGVLYLPRVGSALGQQASRETWRSATDQAVLAGIDPTRSPVILGLLDHEAGAPGNVISPARLGRTPVVCRPGAPSVAALHQIFGPTAEPRAIPVGFEIGVGEPSTPRPAPLPPLPPELLPPPKVSPDTSLVPVTQLVARGPGLPSTTQIIARSAAAGPTTRVKLQQRSPRLQTVDGLGVAELTVDAVQLAHRVQGVAWSEYAGDLATDTPVELGDGRTRWFHPENDRRLRVYEPSERVPYDFALSLGRPDFRVGRVRHRSGSSVAIDYATALQVEEGSIDAWIEFPEPVQAAFGTQWAEIAPSFRWTFGDQEGDSSGGNVRAVFTASGRSRWRAEQLLIADPVMDLPGLAPALRGTWTMVRQVTTLAPPERVTSFFDGRDDVAGSVDFRAPELERVRFSVGRPEVNGVQTVGTILTVPVIP